jgi:phosphopantothenoylcysteine decarboxylase/phosphopantothenate--cysteine ligase
MRVLITAGPTREYLDDVRFLSNASSGRMGFAIAKAARQVGWNVTLVSGPVSIPPPQGVQLVPVVSAVEMLESSRSILPHVDGVIAVAAVADYRPATRFSGKLQRQPHPLTLELVPNPDILAELISIKDQQWFVAFAVESNDILPRARAKLISKRCDAIVANSSNAMESSVTEIRLLDRTGAIALNFRGSKLAAARKIIRWIEQNLIAHAHQNT